MERINAILDDLIEIKIKELTKFKYDIEFVKNGFDRTLQIVKLIEKEIADLNFNEEQQVLYLNKLMQEITTKNIVLYHQSINEVLPVDVTSDILEWMDRYLLAWELKQTENLNTKGDKDKARTVSESDFQEAINNNTQKINEIYNFCKETGALKCDYQDFLNYITKADFSEIINNKEKATKSKLKFTIYTLSYIVGDDWYSKVVQSIDSAKSICSGVTIDERWRNNILRIAKPKTK